MKKKIGVIGAGSMGKHHARILSWLPGAKLAGIADLNEELAKEIAQKYTVPAYKNFEAMLPEVEAVIIATPTQTHFEIGQKCLNAGKHVLMEKPFTTTSDEAKKLLDLARSKQLVLAVGLIERFNPAFMVLKKLIRNEKIIGINIQRFSPFPERITDTDVIFDMMIHDLDLLINLLPKDEIEELKAKGSKVKTKIFDKVSATFFFASGTIAKVDADRVFGIKTRKITVTAEKNLIEADLLNKRVYVRDLQHHIPSTLHVKDQDQLTAELADFIKAIKNNSAPTVTAEAGFKALKLAEEVQNACS